MGFNNGFERVRLENKWKKLRIQYREAGMSEEAIQEMYNFDVQVVNSEQRYYRHTKDLSISDTGTDCASENERVDEAVLTADTYSETKTGFSWVGEIKDIRLYAGLENLSVEDLRLITLYFHDGYSTVELSKVYGIGQQSISKRILKITKFLKNFNFSGVE